MNNEELSTWDEISNETFEMCVKNYYKYLKGW